MWLVMAAQIVTSAGVHELVLERDDAESVLYTLSLPDDVGEMEARPLILALHYAGKDRDYYGRGFLTGVVEPALGELDAIIAAPDSPGGGWNNPESERAVLDLLDHLIEAYPVDSKRVLITGFSMGGMGTWYIASRNPKRFSAAIPMAGAPRGLSEEDLRVFTTLPLYAIHSEADSVVPIAPTRDAVSKLESWGAANVELDVLDQVTHYNVPGFVPSLRETRSWLERVWTRSPR